MKKITNLVLLLSLLFSFSSFAKFSCTDLDELGESLGELAEEFQYLDERDIDRSLDRVLGEVVSALNLVAEVENDKRLSTWIQGLEIAWEDQEKEDFEESLEDVLNRLAEIYVRDCER
jgi:hypothetical protein